MLKWVSIATRRSAWLSTAITAKSIKKSTSATTRTATTTAVARTLTSKSTSINFAMWLLTTLCIIAAFVQATNGFQPIEVNNSEGRKLFGGYRITPKHCRATKTLAISDPRKNGPTICMFNHECAQRNGEVVGACMDGFLFGACCQIPSEQDLESTLLNDAQNSYYQQHQQQKLQNEYGGSQQAVAQSYETYGESQQQHSQETKYSPPTIKPKPKPKPQRTQKPQQQQQQHKYKPQLPKPIYGEVENMAAVELKQPQNSYTQTNIDKVYQQLESSSGSSSVSTYEAQHSEQDEAPSNKYQQSQESAPNASTMYIMESLESAQHEIRPLVGPTASYGETLHSVQTESQQVESQHQDEQQTQQQHNEDLSSEGSLQSEPVKVVSASTDVSTYSSSVELENEAELQTDQVASNTNIVLTSQPRPAQVAFTTSPPPLNDDFVLDLLSTTIPPPMEDDSVSHTTTGLPMRIVNGLTEPSSSSSESNSFEELPATQNPAHATDWEKNTTEEEDSKAPESQEQKTSRPQPKPRPQSQRPRPQVVQMSRPQPQVQPHRPQPVQQQQQQKHKPQQQQQQHHGHNHNHLILDGGEFTHSDITHPGADADLIEDDLQFSTGYGPQPVYMKAPVRAPSPISYNPPSTTTTAPEDKYALVQSVNEDQASKKPPAYGEPTTGTSITTHVDSIESIILQLNSTANRGPTYSIVNQTPQQTPSYDADAFTASKYEPNDSEPYGTTTASMPISMGGSTTHYYDELETKRPDDYYTDNEQSSAQNYSPVTAQAPAYLESVSTNANAAQKQPAHSYVSKPATTASNGQSSTTAVNYADETAAVLDEHTMPANNYNDALQASAHQTHEFNKMPAMGIAYPVDMSHMEDEGNTAPDMANNYGSSLLQHVSTTGSIDKIAEEEIEDSSYGQVPIITGKPQRPVGPYVGVVNAQNYNGPKLPASTNYNDVPQEVSVSSHTTKVQDAQASSPAYHTPKPDTLTTIQYFDGTTLTQRPSISKATTSAYLTPTTTPVPPRPQYGASSTVTSTARPISGIITSSGTRPRPRPRPKPNTARPTTNKKTKPSTAKRPTTVRPATSQYSQAPPQPANNYGATQSQIKKPANVYQEPDYTNNRPAQQPSNTYNDNSNVESSYVKKPAPVSNTQPQPAKKPSKQPTKQPSKQPVKQPASTYQHNKPTYVKRPTAQKQPSGNYNAESATNTFNAEPVYQRPEQQPTYNAEPVTRNPISHLTNSYNGDEVQTNIYTSTLATRKPISHVTEPVQPAAASEQDTKLSAASYGQDTKHTSEDYGQDYDKPDAVYDQHIKAPQPTFESDAYYPAPQPSLNYDPEQQSAATKRPTIIRKPSGENAASNTYNAAPTTSLSSTTLTYHDSEVPPLVVADDKLDSFIQSTAQTENAQSNYQSQIYAGEVKPQYAERPQHTYVHKKPGFVKVTSKPITTTNGIITPKPTLFALVTNSDWPQRPSSVSAIYGGGDNAYPPTTPLPAFSSTSYIYSPLVTRRPELAMNTPQYVGLTGVTTNDFDDPGYYGAQNIAQNVGTLGVHPAFTQSIAETEYGVPSDDRPAFPGYYGPTPTYPPFPIPGEKFGAPVEEETYTSPNDFVNFPPVRNPNLNMSATSSAVTTDLELSTPAFVEDGVLKDKMNTLVNKIVESLQGNFDALADMIDDVNNTAPAAPVSTYQAAGAATTRKPTRKPTRTATAKPTTKRPAVTRVTTKQPTRRPAASTQRPVTRRTTTTRRPTTRKPARRTTTTTTTQAPAEDELVDEEDEEDVNPAENEIGGSQDEALPGVGGRKFKCGVRPHIKSGRIVGGKGSTFGAYPWQVLVRESTWLGLFTKNKCGGVLITNRYVITAAHCQPGFLASLVAVMGEFDISGDLESKRAITKNVKRVIVHRQYDPATFENDLALLELDSPVQFDTHIVPICMPNDHADFTGRMATVTGWGRLKYGGGVPSVLQEVQVPIIENSVCQEMFHTAGHNKKILGSFLCAGYANGQKDSCEGDSGGPLVLQRPDGRYELAGTVSHGIKCAAPYLPGVYMRTTFYKPWLRSITGVK
ncbi:serine protease filzig [Anastrepha obliqua]|uniref:serine protease filzig n=1 Tax=Anastrepha obliqua TaxID=95512 RepID=UPI002409B97B|nr:serine protease filzig [Anastrepha obliqua]